MNDREMFLATMGFGNPTRIPLQPGWGRQSTISNWHAQGLPEGADPEAYLQEALGLDRPISPRTTQVDVDFRMIPQFEEKVLEHKDGHYVVQDWKGNICEISDEFDVTYLRTAMDFVTRRWIGCPVENRDDWEQMKRRYQADEASRFGEDFELQCRRHIERDYVLGVAFSGPFWQLREWCGFEGLCMMMIEQPDLVAEMAAFWADFVSTLLGRVFENVVPDIVHLSEDMAYKAKAMISPAMTREFCKPSWDAWARLSRDAGVPVVAVDSDGYVGELIPIWIESGLNLNDPVEVAAHNDINELRRQAGHQIAFRGGVDKRAIAKGGRAIRDELKRIEPVIRDGGYIPSCDHGVPNDVSWPDFVDYTRLLAKMTGWL